MERFGAILNKYEKAVFEVGAAFDQKLQRGDDFERSVYNAG